MYYEYDFIIRDQLQRGIVKEVSDSEATSNMICYLMHHAVTRHDKKTTKVRVVYDASARWSGPSLNDCYIPTPNLIRKS